MAAIDGPVCLTHSAPDNVYEGHLLFYDVVAPSVVDRSGVLSSIVETGGDALLRLPGMVTLSEFKAWTNTVTSGEHMTKCTDMSHACVVLKAADALDDPLFNQWLQMTAGILHKEAVAQSNRRGGDPQHVSESISKLPDHLQHRVFEAVTGVSGADEVSQECLLQLLPSKHHAAVLAATITTDRALIVPKHSRLEAVADALTAMPATSSPLLSLRLESEVPSHGWGQGFSGWNTISTKAVAGVAAALRHHCELTSLHLSSFRRNCAEEFETIAQALATLTSLKVLHLGGSRDQGLDVPAMPHLKTSLERLPSLQDLKLFVNSRGGMNSLAAKRDREGQPITKEPQPCLASLISAASALTSLKLDVRHVQRHITRSSAISLPFLRNLKIASNRHDTASALLSQLSAPLVSLALEQEWPWSWDQDDVHRCQQLWASLPKFVQLRRLVIHLDTGAEGEVCEEVLSGAPAAIASLSTLQELSIRAAVPLLTAVCQHLADAAVGVQRLQWRCMPEVTSTSEEWRGLLSRMSRMRLQHLDMQLHNSALPDEMPGIASLQALTDLTVLHMSGWRRCLARPADCEALAGMQQLRSVCIDDFVGPPAGHADCVRTLGTLPNLSQLALLPAAADSRFMAAFVQRAPAAPWPALQWVELPVAAEATAESVIRVVAAFPALQKLVLRLRMRYNLREGDHRAETCENIQLMATRAGVSVAFERAKMRFEWRSEWA